MKVPLGPEWVYELKLDGFRGLLHVDAGRGHFTSKASKPMRRFEPLAMGLARTLNVHSAILDGEILVMGKQGPDFNALFFGRGDPAYAAFDLLYLDGRDLRAKPFWRRKHTLQKLVATTPIGYVDYVDDPDLFAVVAHRDLEGIVAKRRSDPYVLGAKWLKVKTLGYSQMEGRWELFERRR